MHPGVAGRADLPVGRAVGVGEVKRVGHAHRAVIFGRRLGDAERAALAIQLRAIALRLVAPLARLLRHEADAIHAVAIVKSGDFLADAALRESAEKVTSTKGLPSVGPFSATSKTSHCSTEAAASVHVHAVGAATKTIPRPRTICEAPAMNSFIRFFPWFDQKQYIKSLEAFRVGMPQKLQKSWSDFTILD